MTSASAHASSSSTASALVAEASLAAESRSPPRAAPTPAPTVASSPEPVAAATSSDDAKVMTLIFMANVRELIGMGFEQSAAERALNSHSGDLQLAINSLLSHAN